MSLFFWVIHVLFSLPWVQAGAQWKAVYEFAESQNVTVVGGANRFCVEDF